MSPVDEILHAFAAKLTELDRRNVRLVGQALSLQDPRDIADHIHGLAYNLRVLHADGGVGGTSNAEAIGAQCIAYLLACARVDELDVTAGDTA